MCPSLQGDETLRYLCKCLFYRFRCRRHFLFQNDFSCFIQNTVERPAISQIHTDRQLLLLENFVTKYLYSANLLHSRSPFCALSTSIIGSVSHPAGDRPSHPIWTPPPVVFQLRRCHPVSWRCHAQSSFRWRPESLPTSPTD